MENTRDELNSCEEERELLPLMETPLLTLTAKPDEKKKKRRLRKPRETYRRQSSDNDYVMHDVIEYNNRTVDCSESAVKRMCLEVERGEAGSGEKEDGLVQYGAVNNIRDNVNDVESVLGNNCRGIQINPHASRLNDSVSGATVDRMQSTNTVEPPHENDEDAEEETAEDELDFNLSDRGDEKHSENVSVTESTENEDQKQKKTSEGVTCDLCQRSFKGRSQLSSHMKTHRRPLRCDVCSIRFASQGSLLWHQRFVHTQQKYNHTCEVCGETVRLKQDLMSHYMTHRLASGVVRCHRCSQAFKNTATLKLHEINLCPRRLAYPVNGGSIPFGPSLAEDLTENQSASADAAEDGRCNERDVDNASNEREQRSTDVVLYSCPFCVQTFHSKGLFTIHTKKHTKPHSCDFCGRGFAKKFTMECHRKTHLNQKDFQCDLCGQAFTLRPQLTKHRTDSHEMQNGLPCQHCGARFKHQGLLRRHELRYCRSAPGANQDIGGANDGVENGGDRRDPETEGSQGHRCLECDKVLGTQWELDQHVKYHRRRFSCEICGNKYRERFLLQSHVFAHLGVRPCKCLVCGATFTMKSHCERHCRMHLRQQHFECNVCGYMFRYEQDRLTHLSEFCLGAKDDQPDLSKMISVEKPDFAQLGITSSMLGYSSALPGLPAPASPAPLPPLPPPPPPHHPPSSPLVSSLPNKENGVDDRLDSLQTFAEAAVESTDVVAEGLTAHKCSICGKKMKKKSRLNTHMAREHGVGEEPFKCFVCGQGAPYERAMRLHLESHVPYKLYGCKNCGVRFSSRRRLSSHEIHEKCFKSTRRMVDSNGATEIEYVDDDLSSSFPLKNFESSSLSTSSLVNQTLTSSTSPLRSGTTTTATAAEAKEEEEEAGASSSFVTLEEIDYHERAIDGQIDLEGVKIKDEAEGVKIKDEAINNEFDETLSSCNKEEEEEDDDDQTICGNSRDYDQSLLVDEAKSNGQDNGQDDRNGQDDDGHERFGGKWSCEQMTTSVSLDVGRSMCVIKKEKNGTGHKVGGQEMEEEEENDERRNQLLQLPLKVKVLRDRMSNERVLVNGAIFASWSDVALAASCTRRTTVRHRDFKEWCDVCQKHIVGKYRCRVHRQRHSQARPFACDVCGKSFKTTDNLRTHMHWHDPSRVIACVVCGARCVSASNMKRHMMVHDGVKPFDCTTCGKSFRRRRYLNTHVRTHTGEMPFACSVCGRRFRIYGSLHDHQKLHSGHKPFECSVCHKRFAQRANWHTHERRHNGVKNFECEVCRKGFVQNYELQNHRLRCVEQDLPYICLLCGMRFTKEHPLKRHLGRHSCDICARQFVVMKEKISHQLKCRKDSKLSVQT